MEDIIFTTQAVIAEGVNPGTSLSEERFWCGTKNGVRLC